MSTLKRPLVAETTDTRGGGECDDAETTCAICLQALDARAPDVCRTPCDHAFHTSCMFRAYSRDARCPLCRADLAVDKGEERERNERLAELREEQRAFEERRRRTEASDGALANLRQRWIDAEIQFEHCDARVDRFFHQTMRNVLDTPDMRRMTLRRAEARSDAHAKRLEYHRELVRLLGPVPLHAVGVVRTGVQYDRVYPERGPADDAAYMSVEDESSDDALEPEPARRTPRTASLARRVTSLFL